MDKQRLNYPWVSQLIEQSIKQRRLDKGDVLEFLDGNKGVYSFVDDSLLWIDTTQGSEYWLNIAETNNTNY